MFLDRFIIPLFSPLLACFSYAFLHNHFRVYLFFLMISSSCRSVLLSAAIFLQHENFIQSVSRCTLLGDKYFQLLKKTFSPICPISLNRVILVIIKSLNNAVNIGIMCGSILLSTFPPCQSLILRGSFCAWGLLSGEQRSERTEEASEDIFLEETVLLYFVGCLGWNSSGVGLVLSHITRWPSYPPRGSVTHSFSAESSQRKFLGLEMRSWVRWVMKPEGWETVTCRQPGWSRKRGEAFTVKEVPPDWHRLRDGQRTTGRADADPKLKTGITGSVTPWLLARM